MAMGSERKGMSPPPTPLVQPAIVWWCISVRLWFVLHRFRSSVHQDRALTFISVLGVSLSVRSSLRTFSSYGMNDPWEMTGCRIRELDVVTDVAIATIGLVCTKSVLHTFIDLTNCMCAVQLPLLRYARAGHLLRLISRPGVQTLTSRWRNRRRPW